jgi:uncharacterized short protein YbdD (DUF466 family)
MSPPKDPDHPDMTAEEVQKAAQDRIYGDWMEIPNPGEEDDNG